MNCLQQKYCYALFFINDDHRQNYQRCIEKFQCRNREYTSTCYIASVPEIFNCFSLQEQIHGPFDWYFDHLQDTGEGGDQTNEEPKGNVSPLTGQTTALVRLAINLWNGYEFDLADGLSIWDSDLYKVALQAIALRRG